MARPKVTVIVLVAGLLLAGYAAGRIQRAPAASSPAAETAARGSRDRATLPVVIAAGNACPATLDADTVRNIVREELSSAGRATAPADDSSSPPERAAEADPQATAAAQALLGDATVVVDRAMTTRRWTPEDRRQWSKIMRAPAMSIAVLELQRKLMMAMNRGEVQTEPIGIPPFGPLADFDRK